MGDKKPPFQPKYEPIRCDVTGHMVTPGAIRKCPEPHVIARYGVGGVANVCVHVCRKCKYHVDYKWHGGVGCKYGMELPTRKES